MLLFLTGEEEIEDVCRRVRVEADKLGRWVNGGDLLIRMYSTKDVSLRVYHKGGGASAASVLN